MGRFGKIAIRTECFVVFPFVFLLIPFPWVCGWVLASAFHEFCHYIAIRLCGCAVSGIEIGVNGAVIHTDFLTNREEFFSALAGPIGGLSLILIAKWCPRIAVCGLFMSFYNLIPLYPLDGGRVLRSVLHRFCPEKIRSDVERYFEIMLLAAIGVLSLYAAIKLDLGLISLIFFAILAVKYKKGKSTCKDCPLGVK